MSVLTDFCTGIANAIRTKKGTTDTILASDFANEIINLPSGGGDLAGIIDGTATSVTIPSGVTAIRDSAFYKCRSLSSVVIPNTVNIIDRCAFYYCQSLTHIDIPSGATSISDSAFYGCFSLTEITIPNSVTALGNYVFCECNGLTSATIPNSIISLGYNAFQDCTSLTTINIENGFNANNLWLSHSPLTVDTMVAILNALADRTGQSTYNIYFGYNNLAKLTDAQKAIATQKNWTLA